MRNRKIDETTKLIASTRIASGAVIAPTRSGQAGPDDLGGRAADLQARVALRQSVAWHELRQERLVADIEEDRQRPGREADHVELPHRQGVGQVGDRDESEHQRPAEIGDDQDGAALETVDPHACRQREQQERQEVDRAQDPDLERPRVEDEDRD